MQTETERKILRAIKELGKTTPWVLSHKLGYSDDYMTHLCAYLARKGYLVREGRYYTLPTITTPPTSSESLFREAPSSPQSQEIREEIPLYQEEARETKSEASSMVEDIYSLAKAIFSSPIGNVRISEDELYGSFVEVEVLGNEREVFEEWLRLLDVLKDRGINIPVYPGVLGKFDLLPGEFGRLVGLALSKMKLPLRGEEPIDVTEMLSQEREE